MEEKILFKVEIDGNENLLNALADLRKETVELQKEQKEYQDALKTGVGIEKVTREEYEKKLIQIKNNRSEMNELTKQVQAQSRTNKDHTDSIKSISRELSAKKIIYRNLTKEQRENQEIGGRLQKQIKELDKEYKDLNLEMGNTQVLVGDYSAQIKGLTPELTQMRKSLQELKLAGKDNTEEYILMRDQAARLQDQIQKTNREIKTFADDALVINTVTDAIKLGTSAFGIYNSVVALTGIENEKLMQMMVKLQAVQTLQNSIQQVSNLLQKDSRLILVGNTIALKAKTVVQNLYTAAIMGSVKAMALLTGGLTVLLGGIALLITNWEKVVNWLGFGKKATDELVDSTENLTSANDRLTTSYSDSVRMLEHQIRLMRAMGIEVDKIEEKQRELINLKIAETKETQRLAHEQWLWGERTKESYEEILAETTKILQELDFELEIFEATRERRIQQTEEKIREEKQKTLEREQQLQIERENLEKRRIEEEEKALIDRLNREELAIAQLLVLQNKSLENELHLLAVRKAQILDNDKLTNAERLLIEEQFRVQIAELRRKYREEERVEIEQEQMEQVDKEGERLRSMYDGFVATREQHMLRMYDVLKQALDKEVITYAEYVSAIEKLDREVLISKMDTYSNVMGLINDAAFMMGANFKLLKGLAISEGLINTYGAALKAFQSVPYPLNFIASASVVAKGLAQVNNIRKQKPPVTMEEGGILKGKSHAQGGIPLIDGNTGRLVAEVEGNEYFAVVNRKDTKTLNMLSDHNSTHGKAFTKTKYAADGGILDLNMNPRQDFQRFSVEDVIRITTEQITSIPVTLLINDVTNLQRKVELLETRGDLPLR